MKRYSAVGVAVAILGHFTTIASAQVTSFSKACISFTECQSAGSTTLTSSASLNGPTAATFASAHTGLVVTHPLKAFPAFAVQTGASGVAASSAVGTNVRASANWSDQWQCVRPCGEVGPWWGQFQWVLHLEGVVSPTIVSGLVGPAFVSMRLSYRIPGTGYSFGFGICIDGAPCGSAGKTYGAGLTTPAGDSDLTSSVVIGTNAAGQTTMSVDVNLGTSFCLKSPACTWSDVFDAEAQIDNDQGKNDLFMDFSGTFIATAVSLDPSNSWMSEGGQTAPISPALTTSTYDGTYLPPLNESTTTASPINNIKNGRVVPVKVQLKQGTTTITDQNSPGPITIRFTGPVACSAAAPPGDIGVYADAGQSSGGTNQFRYDATTQTWIYNLDTRALNLSVGSCYRIDTAVNGTLIPNAFVVVRPTM